MDLANLLEREPAIPWADAGKIPWDDPAFSARMLREHLSQAHDRASRRFETVDRHVSWLHESILGGEPARVLDLGCGPGLYTARLAQRGHACFGIDFSPASIAHARAEAARDGLACEYRHADLRSADFGSGHDAALMIFGELNTFPPQAARALLTRARRALSPAGVLVLEVHDEAFVRAMGQAAPTWFTARQSVFSDEPHLCLRECAWHPEHRATTERHFVFPLSGAPGLVVDGTTQAHTDAEYLALLRGTGFARVERHPSLTGSEFGGEPGLFVLVAHGDESGAHASARATS